MEQDVEEKIIVSADEIDNLCAEDRTLIDRRRGRAGFNYNKLYAVLCMLASALLSVSFIAWLILA